MIVWLVNPFDNLPGEGFRPGRYELLAEAFAAAGHEVVWWTADFSHSRKVFRQIDGAPSARRFSVNTIPTLPYRANVSLVRIISHWAFARSWLAAAKRSQSRPELMVVSLPPLSTGLAALKFKREFGGRVVVDIQDAWPETFYRLLPRGLRALSPLIFWPLRRMARRICRGADQVVGVADNYAKLALAYGAKNYRRFRLGARFQANPPPRIASGNRLRVAYVGSLSRGYDLATVKRAVALIEGAELVIAGPALVHREGQVDYRGYLGEKELQTLLSSCDVGVVPMSDDTWVAIPNKVADYAAASLPIVTSLRGECRELLERTATGVYYPYGEVTTLAQAIKRAAAMQGGDFAALRAELDADKIYADFVKFVGYCHT